MKTEKKNAMIEEISEYIADHDMKNRHYLTDAEVIERFNDVYKKKHIKEILLEIR